MCLSNHLHEFEWQGGKLLDEDPQYSKGKHTCTGRRRSHPIWKIKDATKRQCRRTQWSQKYRRTMWRTGLPPASHGNWRQFSKRETSGLRFGEIYPAGAGCFTCNYGQSHLHVFGILYNWNRTDDDPVQRLIFRNLELRLYPYLFVNFQVLFYKEEARD